MAERINVLFIAPKQPPCVRQIVNDLRSKQELVEGHIEIVRPFDNNIVAVCNDEGVINGMPFNRELNNGTFIFGPMFLCKERLGEDGYQLDGLNETELVRYQKQFAKPEVLVNWGGHYMALPMALFNEALGPDISISEWGCDMMSHPLLHFIRGSKLGTYWELAMVDRCADCGHHCRLYRV